MQSEQVQLLFYGKLLTAWSFRLLFFKWVCICRGSLNKNTILLKRNQHHIYQWLTTRSDINHLRGAFYVFITMMLSNLSYARCILWEIIQRLPCNTGFNSISMDQNPLQIYSYQIRMPVTSTLLIFFLKSNYAFWTWLSYFRTAFSFYFQDWLYGFSVWLRLMSPPTICLSYSMSKDQIHRKH